MWPSKKRKTELGSTKNENVASAKPQDIRKTVQKTLDCIITLTEVVDNDRIRIKKLETQLGFLRGEVADLKSSCLD